MTEMVPCVACGRRFDASSEGGWRGRDHKLLEVSGDERQKLALCPRCRGTGGRASGKLFWLLVGLVTALLLGLLAQSRWVRDYMSPAPERVMAYGDGTRGPNAAPRANPFPRGNPGGWVSPSDYPARSLRDEVEGTTGFRLTIGRDGVPTGCTVTRSSGSADLDEATCRSLGKRARFSPATDAAGNPVEGSWTSRVRWEIPR